MNTYQHAFFLTIMVACAMGVWSTYESGKPANAFLFAVAAVIAVGYILGCSLQFFLLLGTL